MALCFLEILRTWYEINLLNPYTSQGRLNKQVSVQNGIFWRVIFYLFFPRNVLEDGSVDRAFVEGVFVIFIQTAVCMKQICIR